MATVMGGVGYGLYFVAKVEVSLKSNKQCSNAIHSDMFTP